jgi:hypothetical protein
MYLICFNAFLVGELASLRRQLVVSCRYRDTAMLVTYRHKEAGLIRFITLCY